jgi:hypothetical protein
MPIPNLQYLWPNKESRPESYTYVLFYHCLCIRHGHRSGHCLDERVRRFFLLNSQPPIDIIKVPSRLDMLHRLSGTHHKLRQNASYHVSHIFSHLVM